MKKNYLTAVSAALVVCMLFAGCGRETPPETTQAPDTTVLSTESSVPKTTEGSVPSAAPETTQAPAVTDPAETESTQPASENTATVYIGREISGYQEYSVELSGPMTPDTLIEAIADLTGWKLTLTEPVSVGKGGMTVILSRESALVAGPPIDQKDEFLVFDVDTLVVTLLDSIQETLQRNFVSEPGDPNSLDIYFSLDGGDIDIPNTNIHYSQYEPWDSSKLEH